MEWINVLGKQWILYSSPLKPHIPSLSFQSQYTCISYYGTCSRFLMKFAFQERENRIFFIHHWASKILTTHLRWHSLKYTASKLIIFRYSCAIILLMKHIWKNFVRVNKEKMHWNRKRSLFQKSQNMFHERAQRKAAFSEHLISIRSISMMGYVTTALAFISGVHRAREASSFCDFWKITFCDFTAA